MAWNGSGTYLLSPTFSPEVNGTLVDATRYNGLTSDIAGGITAALAKNGENVPTANLPMSGFKHTNAGIATGTGQYIVLNQLADATNALQGAGLVGYSGSLTYLSGSVGYQLKALQTSVDDKRIIQNSQSADYTTVLSDAGKHIYHPSTDTTARVWTIAANSSVAYDIGVPITFVNHRSAGALTIAINTDTLTWAAGGATGSRTLAPGGVATALKITATEWIISGAGLT